MLELLLKYSGRLPALAILVGLDIACTQRECRQGCFKGVKRLARELQVSVRTLYAQGLLPLQEAGLLTWSRGLRRRPRIYEAGFQRVGVNDYELAPEFALAAREPWFMYGPCHRSSPLMRQRGIRASMKLLLALMHSDVPRSQHALGLLCGRSERSVQRDLKRLRQRGFVLVRRCGPRAARYKIVYPGQLHVLLPEPWQHTTRTSRSTSLLSCAPAPRVQSGRASRVVASTRFSAPKLPQASCDNSGSAKSQGLWHQNIPGAVPWPPEYLVTGPP